MPALAKARQVHRDVRHAQPAQLAGGGVVGEAAQPLGALRWTKRTLLAVREDGIRAARAREDAAFLVRVGSPENQEALRAFFEKRPPDFRKVPPTDRS